MIKANELRIGNWVLYTGFGAEDKDYCRITELKEGIPLTGLQPIPLTPEILEKLGFEKTTYKYSDGSEAQGFIKDAFLIRKSEIREGYSAEWFPYKQSQNIMPIDFIYLHTLQNFFALTGNELEIKDL